MLRITVLGTGYVGLVSGVCLAEIGHHVTCIDKNSEKIAALKAGIIPIYEDGLEELTRKNTELKRLEFSTDLKDSLNQSDIVMIAVGTPTSDDNSGSVDLSYINACVDEIGQALSKNIVVIVKSTVPVGTCDSIQEKLNKISKFECVVVSNPEFLREGTAVYDFMNPDRIIFGSDGRGHEVISQLYTPLSLRAQRGNPSALYVPQSSEMGCRAALAMTDGGEDDDGVGEGPKIIYADRKTAELIKYASNTFLAMKVGFINEIADISEKVGADIKKLSEGIGSDKRIGHKFLNPGPGFGGSCFPKDVMALSNLVSTMKLDSVLIGSIIQSNTNRIKKIAREIIETVPKGAVLTVLGLTYKAGTDDVRDSPSMAIIEQLINAGYQIKTHDPAGIKAAKDILGDKVEYYSDLYEACTGSSLVVVATEWDSFKTIDVIKLREVVKKPVIYDLRGIIDKAYFLKNNFKVKSIGYKEDATEFCPS